MQIMSPQEQIYLLILFISLIFSAFFSGLEMAFVSSDKFKVELDKNKENLKGKLLSVVTHNPSRFIGTMLIGNNICLVIYGFMTAALLEKPLGLLFNSFIPLDYIEFSVILSQTILSTILILIVGEFLPKAITNIFPNWFLNVFLLPITFFYYLLYFFVSFTVFLSNIILRYVFRIKLTKEEVSFERTDLNYYLQEISSKKGNGKNEIENEVKILQNVLEFPSVRARECMIPRTEITGIEIHEDIETLKKLFEESGLSKIMVYRDSIDEIIGYVHSFDIFKKPLNIQSILISIVIVPETILIKDILTQFIQQRKSVAIVVDEYGGTAGLITMEDIIEEIFGEIEDEHDVEDLIEKKLSDTEYQFSGRHEIDYLNEEYHLNLPKNEEYTTLAGLVLHYTQEIPQKGEVIDIENFKIIINKVSHTRIEEVLLHIKKD